MESRHPAIQRQECAWCEVRRPTEEPERVGTGLGAWPEVAWWLLFLGSWGRHWP